MDTKINKILIIIAVICTIIPFNVLIPTSVYINNMLLLYIPMFIGYMLYFSQYEKYSNKQKKLFKIALYTGIANIISGTWNEFDSLLTVILAFLFYIFYFIHRIFSLLLCINILKDKWSKTKVIMTLIIVSIVFCLFIIICSKL